MKWTPKEPIDYQTAYLHLTLENGATHVVEKQSIIQVTEILRKGPVNPNSNLTRSLVMSAVDADPIEVMEDYKAIVAVLEAYNKFRLSID